MDTKQIGVRLLYTTKRVVILMVMSALWLVCSLPLITLSAATTALYAVTFHMIRESCCDLSSCFSVYLQSLRWNSFRASLVGAVLFAVGGVLTGLCYGITHLTTSHQHLLFFLFLLMGSFYLVLLTHAFPALAHDCGNPFFVVCRMFKQALGNGIYMLVVMLITLLPIVLLARSIYIGTLQPWMILAFFAFKGFSTYGCSLHFLNLLDSNAT